MNSTEVIYIGAFLLTIVFGFYYRTIRDKNLKKNVGTWVGLAIVLLTSGLHSLHVLITALINTIIILKMKKRRFIASLVLSFSYLVFFRSTAYFGIPDASALTNLMEMILILKLVGLAAELDDSEVNTENDQEENEDKIEIHYMDIFHYCFNYVGVLAGPYYKYRTFIDYFNYPFSDHAKWNRAALNKIKYALVCGLLHAVFSHMWPVSAMTTEEFYERSWWDRHWYMFPMTVILQTRLFVAFLLSTAACIIAGFGAYPNFTNPRPGRGPSKNFNEMKELLSNEAHLSTVEYSFETINNANIYQLEFCMTIREMIKNWNCCVQYWLVANIYRRFPYENYRVAATFLVSSLWHGTYLGYYFTFGFSFFVLLIEDVFVKLYPKNSEGRVSKIYEWIHWIFKLHCFSYYSVSFQLLRVDLVLKFYNSIYHVGTVGQIILYVIGLILLKVKATKAKKIK